MLGAKMLELQQAVDRYGQASIRNYKIIHPIGERIINGFAAYLGEAGATQGVPPQGSWRHDTGGYSDAKFTTYSAALLQVAEISMGLALRIPHSKDDGALWMRVVLEFLIEGGTLSVQVGDGITIKGIPLECSESDLDPLYEAIFVYLKGIFVNPVDYAEAERAGKIGFLADR